MFHAFEKYLPPDAEEGAVTLSIAEGTTLEDLLNGLGIPDDIAKLVLINGVSQGACTGVKHNVPINDNDTISIFPPVAGG